MGSCPQHAGCAPSASAAFAAPVSGSVQMVQDGATVQSHMLPAADHQHCCVYSYPQGAVAAAGADEDDEEGMVSVVPEDLRLEVLAARRGGASRSSRLVGPLAGVRLPDRPVVSGEGHCWCAWGRLGSAGALDELMLAGVRLLCHIRAVVACGGFLLHVPSTFGHMSVLV